MKKYPLDPETEMFMLKSIVKKELISELIQNGRLKKAEKAICKRLKYEQEFWKIVIEKHPELADTKLTYSPHENAVFIQEDSDEKEN